MDNLPIPNMRSSWVSALINTIIAFFLYYVFAFGWLLNEYKDHFVSGSFEESKENLIVWVDVPRYFYPAGPATIHIHIKNQNLTTLKNVKAYLVTRPDPESSTLLIPNVFNSNVYSSEVEFQIIEPLSTAVGRISFVTQSNTSITSVLLVVDEGEPQQLSAISEMRFAESSAKALQTDFLEHILLPPWSNGFILSLVLLSTFLIRTDVEQKTESSIFSSDYVLNPEWKRELVKDYKRSTLVFCIMLLITLFFYIMLGVVGNDAVLPLAGLIFFTALSLMLRQHDLKNRPRFLSQAVIFLGFVFSGLVSTLFFFRPEIALTTFSKVLWILLGLEGLAVFVWLSRQESSSMELKGTKETPVSLPLKSRKKRG